MATYNCHGLKSAIPFVTSLLNSNDILFICKHWLHPGEISTVSQCHLSSYWSNLKSSMNPVEVTQGGRPYGGCGFICKRVTGLVYKPIPCTSDRISGLQVISHQQTMLTIFCVYLPYDGHNAETGGLRKARRLTWMPLMNCKAVWTPCQDPVLFLGTSIHVCPNLLCSKGTGTNRKPFLSEVRFCTTSSVRMNCVFPTSHLTSL